jgi:hypothetical protein
MPLPGSILSDAGHILAKEDAETSIPDVDRFSEESPAG